MQQTSAVPLNCWKDSIFPDLPLGMRPPIAISFVQAVRPDKRNG